MIEPARIESFLADLRESLLKADRFEVLTEEGLAFDVDEARGLKVPAPTGQRTVTIKINDGAP